MRKGGNGQESSAGRGWLRLVRIKDVDFRVHPGALGALAGMAVPFTLVGLEVARVSASEALGFGTVASLALFALLFLHELGHTLAARWLKLEPVAIELFSLGAATVIRHRASSPRIEMVLSAAGPAANVIAAFAAGLAAVLTADPASRGVALSFAGLSFGFALLNLVPIYPQDGGKLLHALLWRLSRDDEGAARAATLAGLTLAALIFGAGWLGRWPTVAVVGAVFALQSVLLPRGGAAPEAIAAPFRTHTG